VHGLQIVEDFIVHELTHHRQQQLLKAHAGDPDWRKKRCGTHRDKSWYAAIAEAAPNFLGVRFREASWPTGPRSHKGGAKLSEVEATHWPDSFRDLVKKGDSRLPPNSIGCQVRRCPLIPRPEDLLSAAKGFFPGDVSTDAS
jgi:hypothetical protein